MLLLTIEYGRQIHEQKTLWKGWIVDQEKGADTIEAAKELAKKYSFEDLKGEYVSVCLEGGRDEYEFKTVERYINGTSDK